MTLNQEQVQEQEFKEQREHHEMLLNIRAVITTKTGRDFIKYLFREFEVGGLPPMGMTGDLLMDKLGSLRTGQAIFDIVAQADPEGASSILAQLTREKHV